MYKCINCGEKIETLPKGTIRCPVCAFKIISKEREPITKKLKAR